MSFLKKGLQDGTIKQNPDNPAFRLLTPSKALTSSEPMNPQPPTMDFSDFPDEEMRAAEITANAAEKGMISGKTLKNLLK